MYPTFLQLGDIPVKEDIDGLSLVPALLKSGKQIRHEYFYWEFHENEGRQAVLWGNWKGVRLAVNKNPDAAIELYDLKKDPGEKNNVAATNPYIVEKIGEFMNNAHQSNSDWPLLYKEINRSKQ